MTAKRKRANSRVKFTSNSGFVITSISGMLIAVLALMMPATSFGAEGTFQSCPEIGVTYRVVSCFNIILTQAMTDIYIQIKPLFLNIAGAAAVLSVVMFGMRVSTGGVNFSSSGLSIPQGGGETVMLALKIGLMMFFINSFDQYYPLAFESSTGLIEVVTAPLDSTMIEMGCTEKMMEADPTGIDPGASDYRIRMTWARVDCLVGAMLGFGVVSGGTFMGIAPVIEGALTSSLSDDTMGSIGPLVVYMGYTMMFGVLMAAFRTLYVYVYSMIAIAFLWMIAPLAGMCLLFKATTEYFTKWVTYIISMILQPVLMLCFLTIMIVALDRAIYTSPYSLLSVLTGKIACDASTGQCDYEVWKEALEEMRTTGKIGKCKVNTFSVNRETLKMNDCTLLMENRMNPAGTQQVPTEAQYIYKMAGQDCSQNMPTSALTSFSSGHDGFTNFSVDKQCLNGVDPIELFASMSVIAVICYLLYQTMEFIPEFATRVTSGPALTSAAAQSMPFQAQMKKGAEESAAAFIKKYEPEDAMKGFMRGAGGSLPWIGRAIGKEFEDPPPPQPTPPPAPGSRGKPPPVRR